MAPSCRHLLLLGLLVLFAAAPLRADEYADELDGEDAAPAAASGEAVVTLTAANFDDIIAKHKFVLAEFYAPWCGHCKNLAPHYEEAAKALKQKDPSIVIGKVDATVETVLAKTFDIKGYPTLKWFVDGEPMEYTGPREAAGITQWVLKHTGPPTIVVDSPAKLAELEKEHEVLVLGWYMAQEGAEYEAFLKLAQATDDVTFVETAKPEVAKLAGVNTLGGIGAIKNFKGEPREVVAYSARDSGQYFVSDADALRNWVTAEKLPLTLEFNQANSDKIFNSGINKQVILWAPAAALEAKAPLFTAFKETAKKLKGQLVFVTVNMEGEEHSPVTNFFGLKDQTPPQVVGFFMEDNKKYKMASGDMSADALEAFAKGVVDGTAPQDFKSQPVPETATDEDGVTTVVGKSVDTVVMDATKDVLLEVYAPWCGHCKALEPIYQKLGKRFKKVDSVVIAKMDGTENEHPAVSANGYPTLLFYPAEAGAAPIPFSGGDRSLLALTKFIKEHAKVPYELPKKANGGDADEDGKDEL